MITAPNSLIPRAHIRFMPERIPRQAKGSDIVKKVYEGEAPNVLAMFSSLGGTEINACRAALTRNGNETKAMAIEIPTVVHVSPLPRSRPRNDCLPITVSKAMPAAECGIIIGRSMIASNIDRPKNFFRASRYARGIPTKADIVVAKNAAVSVNLMDCITWRSAAASVRSVNEVASTILINGATTNKITHEPRAVKINPNHGICAMLFWLNFFTISSLYRCSHKALRLAGI